MRQQRSLFIVSNVVSMSIEVNKRFSFKDPGSNSANLKDQNVYLSRILVRLSMTFQSKHILGSGFVRNLTCRSETPLSECCMVMPQLLPCFNWQLSSPAAIFLVKPLPFHHFPMVAMPCLEYNDSGPSKPSLHTLNQMLNQSYTFFSLFSLFAYILLVYTKRNIFPWCK